MLSHEFQNRFMRDVAADTRDFEAEVQKRQTAVEGSHT